MQRISKDAIRKIARDVPYRIREKFQITSHRVRHTLVAATRLMNALPASHGSSRNTSATMWAA
jgi:hypothetical protein